MIKVCGHRLMVKPILIEETDEVFKRAKASGLLVERDPLEKKREHESVDQGVVVQIGPTAWRDFNSDPWTKVGDTVVYARGAGKKVVDPEDQEIYICLNDEDVVAVTKEAE
jgi:co-chaperonin GroES (HSP10)